MSRIRHVPPVMRAPVHSGETKNCTVMTDVAVHTITLEQGSFAALVLSNGDGGTSVISILDEDDVEAHIALLRNAIEDAKLLDSGHATKHAAESALNH